MVKIKMKPAEKTESKTVDVKMLVSQNGADFGDREKDDIFPMNADLAKLHEERGILKIIIKAKNVNK